MRLRSWSIAGVALLLMGGAAFVLGHVASIQRLGEPGIRVVGKPVYGPEGQVVGTNKIDLPETVLDYESKEQPIAQMVLDWLPKDTTFGQRVYTASDDFALQMNAVLMGADRTSIHKPEYCLTGVGWKIDASERETILVEKPHPYDLQVMKLIVSREVQTADGTTALLRGLYVYWFVADERLTADHNRRMLSMAWEMVRSGVLQRWAYISCFTICLPGQEEATFQRVKEFIAASVPEFQLAAGEPAALAQR